MAFSPSLHIIFPLCICRCVQISPLYKDTSRIELGTIEQARFNVITFEKIFFLNWSHSGEPGVRTPPLFSSLEDMRATPLLTAIVLGFPVLQNRQAKPASSRPPSRFDHSCMEAVAVDTRRPRSGRVPGSQCREQGVFFLRNHLHCFIHRKTFPRWFSNGRKLVLASTSSSNAGLPFPTVIIKYLLISKGLKVLDFQVHFIILCLSFCGACVSY